MVHCHTSAKIGIDNVSELKCILRRFPGETVSSTLVTHSSLLSPGDYTGRKILGDILRVYVRSSLKSPVAHKGLNPLTSGMM